MPTTITIDGTPYDAAGRAAVRLRLERMTAPELDGPDSLEFTEIGAVYPGTWHADAAVTLTIDGVLRFTGRIVSKAFGEGAEGIQVGYQAQGLRYLAMQVPVTHPQDGSGSWTFNLPPGDEDYAASESGRTVGQILNAVLTAQEMAAGLAAQGVGAYVSTSPYTLPAATVADLANLSITPPEPVTIAGERLWNSLVQVLARWQCNHAPYIQPDGTIRVLDTTAFTPATLTLGVDPVLRPSLSHSVGDCATRVVVRGSGDVEAAILVYEKAAPAADNDLKEADAWQPYKADWTIADFEQPRGATDSGSVTAVGSTTVTVASSDAARTWAANFWADNEAQVQLKYSLGTGITMYENRPITANTALTAGGTSVLTLAYALTNTNYDSYTLIGKAGGRVDTWRLYDVTDPWIAAHLMKRFPRPVAWAQTGRGTARAGTASYPAAVVGWSSTGGAPYFEVPATFDIVPGTGQIRFHQPTVVPFSTPQQLQDGGAAVEDPDELMLILPYNRGNLTAVHPPDVGGLPQYAGGAYAGDGLQRTLTVLQPTWEYKGDLPSMLALAQMYHSAVSAPVVEGTVVYLGKYTPGLTAGLALNVAHPTRTTGFEALNAPVRSVSLEWPQEGGSSWRTNLRISTRRKPYTGDRLYLHPAFGHADWGGGFTAGDFGALTGGHGGSSPEESPG